MSTQADSRQYEGICWDGTGSIRVIAGICHAPTSPLVCFGSFPAGRQWALQSSTWGPQENEIAVCVKLYSAVDLVLLGKRLVNLG